MSAILTTPGLSEATAMSGGSHTDWVSWKRGLVFAALATGAFHLAFGFPALGFLILLYLYGLIGLTGLATARRAFYFGLATGYAVYAPHLAFFWTIFGWPAIALWTVLAFWLGLFVALGRLCRLHFGRVAAAILIPCVWTGIEYFRSELYYLRFSWLSAGYAFADLPRVFVATGLGIYGVGWLMAACASFLGLLKWRTRIVAFAGVITTIWLAVDAPLDPVENPIGRRVKVAGIQLEYPYEKDVVPALDRIVQQEGSVDLIVLSEYTLQRSPSDEIRDWCRRNHRYLAVGGKEFLADSKFANTVFVIDPNGEIIFRQVKSVPVQFFDDGVPAREQQLWDSPWGKIGFCICYDLSYRKITDRLIHIGAEALIVVSADESSWGREQHLQHARIAPVRAAEHRIPIFRVACTGFSQWVAADGHVLRSAPFPGQGEIIHGQLDFNRPGRLPIDHWLAPFCVGVTAVMSFWLLAKSLLGKVSKA